MYVSVLPACMPMHYVCLVSEEARRDLDALELELQMVVIHHAGAGNWILVLCSSSSALATELSLQPFVNIHLAFQGQPSPSGLLKPRL